MAAPFNPYAFPSSETQDQGMSLRDYFAAAALTGLIHHYHEELPIGPNPFVELSDLAYRYADAMLAEREKGGR